MTDEEKLAILDEIVALSSPPVRQPLDITAQDYADRAGCTPTTAQSRLRKLVEAGVLVTEMVWDLEIQHNVRVWRKIDPSTEHPSRG